MTPLLELNYSASIKLNIGNENFMYDFSKYITPNVISTKNNFTNFNLDISDYMYKSMTKEKVICKWNNSTYINNINQEGMSIVENIQSDLETIDNLINSV